MSPRPSEPTITRAQRRRLERSTRARGGARPKAAHRTPAWRSPIAVVSGLAVVAATVVILVLSQKTGSSMASTSSLVSPTTSYTPGLLAGDAMGRLDAPVTLDVWSDFQCPFCGQFARSYLPRLVSDFVANGQLRIVAHDVDFTGRGGGDESVAAAVGARCAADQGKYWQFHDILFWNQNGENEGAFSDARLVAMADSIGLDRSSWDACRTDSKRAKAVAATTSQALSTGINSTPTLVLNGRAAAGLPRTYDDLASAIGALLPASLRSAGAAPIQSAAP